MTATPLTPTQIRRSLGPAIWLLSLLVRLAPANWTGNTATYVANSNPVSDAFLAKHLEISLGTVSRWRLRLRAAGIIGWLVDPGRGRVFWVGAVNRILGPIEPEKPATESSASTEAESTAPLATRWLQ